MKIPSESNETGRTGPLYVALHEAARYEAETGAPADLVVEAMARYRRSGSRCSQMRLLRPGLVASACGLVLLLGVTLWSRIPPRLAANFADSGPKAVRPAAIKSDVPDLSRLPLLAIARSLLPSIDAAMCEASPELPCRQHPLVHRAMRTHPRFLQAQNRLYPYARQAQNRPCPAQTQPTAGLWTKEIVQREVITQTVTSVWVAQSDSATASIILTPALFQLALQPEDGSDATDAPVAATLIPVSLEQENNQP